MIKALPRMIYEHAGKKISKYSVVDSVTAYRQITGLQIFIRH